MFSFNTSLNEKWESTIFYTKWTLWKEQKNQTDWQLCRLLDCSFYFGILRRKSGGGCWPKEKSFAMLQTVRQIMFMYKLVSCLDTLGMIPVIFPVVHSNTIPDVYIIYNLQTNLLVLWHSLCPFNNSELIKHTTQNKNKSSVPVVWSQGNSINLLWSTVVFNPACIPRR